MSFFDLVNRRQSVRQYADKPVEREKIETCLEAARLAPSTSNSQPWKFIVVDDPDLRSIVAKESVAPFRSFNTFTDQVPVLVAVMADKISVYRKSMSGWDRNSFIPIMRASSLICISKS